NGNHLVLSGNCATMSYLKTIGAADCLSGPREASFVFCDLQSDRRWTISLGRGRLPLWVFARSRRVPDTSLGEYLRFAALLRDNRGRAVHEVVRCEGAVWDRLLRPLLLAALNMAPEFADAGLAGAVLRETIARGGAASLPRIASPNLATAFVEPAIAFLRLRHVSIRFGERLRAIEMESSAASALVFGDNRIALSPGDRVIIAVASGIAAELLPGILAPDQSSAIVKEKRATFTATPEQAAKRSGTRTPLKNVFLAGDWTATGLPATIEGAVRSGQRAAEVAIASLEDERR